MVFFLSWQLWEQLSFVLAACLCGVFVIGYVKLLLVNRIVRKHELVDVEKRMRIEEMRQSGQLEERGEEEEEEEEEEEAIVPFGIRALDSGVEVQGIWISRESTPVPEEKRIGRYVKRKSDASDFSIKSSHSSQSLQLPSLGKSARRKFSNGFGVGIEYPPTFDIGDEGAGKTRPTYKPVRSSQLRYSSYNGVEHDPDTLGKLEGNVAAKDGVNWHRPSGGPTADPGIYSHDGSFAESADNERSSGSSGRSMIPTVRVTSPSISFHYEPTQVQQGGYSRMDVPQTSGISNPFITPDHTPLCSNASSRSIPDSFHTAAESSVEADLLLVSSDSRSTSSPERSHVAFPHANQSTRHVNSGFSVLPFGNFPTESKGKDTEREACRDSQSSGHPEKKKPNKLRRKARFSVGGKTHSKDSN